jgi:hypothetical protein
MSACNCEHCITLTKNNDQWYEDMKAEEVKRDRIGLLFTTISTFLGFAFWPFMVTFLTGRDLFEMMANGNFWFNSVWVMILTVTSAFCGTMAILYYKDRA